MGKQKAPAPPDPRQTSAAQTGTNVATALANTSLQNVNRVGADGSTLNYNVTGKYDFYDPYTGQTYGVPQYTATEKLSPKAQWTYDASQEAQLNLAESARNQSNNVEGMLSQAWKPDMSGFASTNQEWQPNMGGLTDLTKSFAPNTNGLTQLNQQWSPDMSAFASTGKEWKADTSGLTDLTKSFNPNMAGMERLDQSWNPDTSAIESRLFDLGSRTLDPKFAREREDMRTQLSNQGIKLGSDAFDRASRNITDTQSQAYNDLALRGRGQAFNELSAINADKLNRRALSFGEQQAMNADALTRRGISFGEQQATDRANMERRNVSFAEQAAMNADALNRRGLSFAEQQTQNDDALRRRGLSFGEQHTTNAVREAQRARAMQEQQAIRNQPLNELSALLSGSQVSMPNYQINTPSNIPTTDNAALIANDYQSRLAAWQQKNAQRQSLYGGILGLGGSAIMGGL